MDAEKLDDISRSLALCAVTGNRSELVKVAAEYTKQAAGPMDYLANPYVRNALLGLGAGGLVGMLQPKRKLRNALTYGLVGGLGGVGLTPLLNQLGAAEAAEPKPDQTAGREVKDLGAAAEMVANADPEARRAVGAGIGALTGASAGYRGTVGLLKNRNALQNLLDVETNAANARNWRGAPRPAQVSNDTLAARQALLPVRNALQPGAPRPQQQAFVDEVIRTAPGASPSASPDTRRLQALATLGDASEAVRPGGVPFLRRESLPAFIRNRLPGTDGTRALAALSEAAQAAETSGAAAAGAPVRATPSANQLHRALAEANRLAPTTWRQRAAGGLGAMGLGYLGSLLGGSLGEGQANFANRAFQQKAFGQ